MLPRGLAEIERDRGMLLMAPQISERLMRAFDLKGDLPQALENYFNLSIAVADLEETWYRRLRRQVSAAAGTNVGAVAGQAGWFLVRPQQGNILQTELITIHNPGAGPVSFLIYSGGLPVGGAGVNVKTRDNRDAQPEFTSATFAPLTGTTAIPVSAGFFTVVPAGASKEIDLAFVAADGFGGVVVQCASVNQAFNVGIAWTERPMTQPEAQ